MLLTLLQSRAGPVPPPVPPSGGGTGTSASRRRGQGWMRERAMLEASLARFEQDQLRRIAQTLADSEQPQAQRIARKLIDYDGEITQIESLQRELGKLEAAQRTRLASQEREQDVRAAAADLTDFLRDEEDAMHALMALDELEAAHLFGVMGVKLH